MVVPVERLAYARPDGRRGVEAGGITLLPGLSGADIRHTKTIDVPELVLDQHGSGPCPSLTLGTQPNLRCL